nr:hypothetical protein [Desulfobulbaceae bacterium]
MPHTVPDFIKALMAPNAYPHKVDTVKLIQTHISYVLIAGDFVYKIKKPVNFGFLNFTSLDKRKFFCEEELRLNRRLCPSIYLETLPINHTANGHCLGGSGETIDYCVKMVRMPDSGMMGNVIAAGKLTREHIDAIVAILEPFYETAQGGKDVAQNGTAEAVGVNVIENFTQTEQFVGCPALNKNEFDAINSYSRRFLEKSHIFEKRIAQNRIKDCHGDLHSANICLADSVYIYDCIEFNTRFRFCDIASDLAFLAMDLDYHNLTDLSSYLISRYKEDSGDTALDEVLNFYKCYRASVRGKIGLLTAHEQEVDEKTRATSLRQATKYYLLAQKYARG